MPSERELARAHVLRAREIISQQRARIADLRRDSEHRALSESILKSFEETLTIFEADLARLEQEARYRGKV